jgi:hypothetical protein
MINDIERIEITDIDGSSHWVRRSGLMFIYSGTLTCALTVLHDAARIPDFGRMDLKRPRAIMDRILAMGFGFETRYDAAHGRRYMICVYAGQPFSAEKRRQRRIAIAAADGITNLRQHHIDCGCSPAELDRLAKGED